MTILLMICFMAGDGTGVQCQTGEPVSVESLEAHCLELHYAMYARGITLIDCRLVAARRAR